MKLHLRLALHALLRNRLSLALLVTAVTAGVAFQIPNSANLEGYTRELLRQGMVRSTGHLQVTADRSGALREVAPLLRKLGALPFARAVVPRLIHGGVLFRRGEPQPVRLVGIQPELEERASGLCRRLARGRCPAKRDDRAVLLGSALAEKLQARVGERLKLVVPYQDLGELKYASAWYLVLGVLEGGGGFSADSDLFLHLDLLRRLAGAEESATSISIYLDDPERAAAQVAEVRRQLPAGVSARPWWEVSQFVADAIAGNRAIAAISMAMVIAAVMIPVSALLYILVLHERRPIAILGALGFTRLDLFSIYLSKSLFVGVAGVLLGNGLGYAICCYFEARPIFSHGGFVVRPVFSLSVAALPSLVLFAVTFLAGIVPALLAARSNPATELRED